MCRLGWMAALLITSFGLVAKFVDGDPGAELTDNIEAGLVAFDGISIAGNV